MKVDFNTSYSNVSKLIDRGSAQKKPEGEAPAFAKLLGSISPTAIQLAEETSKPLPPGPILASPEDQDAGPMASYKFALPEPMAPVTERSNVTEPSPSSVNISTGTVKPPTIVDVRRVDRSALVEMRRTERIEAVRAMVEDVGNKQGIDPLLSMSVVSVESNFNPSAISRDGHRSKGLFQLLDTTGKQYLEKLGLAGHYDPFDPKQNVELGIGYLRYLHEIFSKETEIGENTRTVPAANSASLEKLAVAAFNAGEGRVASAQERALRAGLDPSEYQSIESYLPESTQDYVRSVLEMRTQFEGQPVG